MTTEDRPITSKEARSLYSSLSERIVEHLFLGEVLRNLWRKQLYQVEVSRAESDSFGYDVVIEVGKVIRHIQLKSNLERPRSISVVRSLAQKPSACVVWIGVTLDLELKEFGWFGSEPGSRIASLDGFDHSTRIGRNLEGRPKRANHVDVPFGANFKLCPTTNDIVARLFGQHHD